MRKILEIAVLSLEISINSKFDVESLQTGINGHRPLEIDTLPVETQLELPYSKQRIKLPSAFQEGNRLVS